MLAFNRGCQWTGKYTMGFQELVDSHPEGEGIDHRKHENGEECDGTLALANAMQKALQLRDKDPCRLVKGMVKSGAEFSVTRSYHGLQFQTENCSPEACAAGRSGRASRYIDEKSRQGKHVQQRTKLDEEMLKKGLQSNSFNNLGPKHTF